ncbi:MAG: hypothetical protein IPL46_25590 [Saprospiraceae bacterium]|nr:hypothetical protein [Saprospiraceae bacterium]
MMRSFPDFRVCFEKIAEKSEKDSLSKTQHNWEDGTPYLKEFEHPLWKFLRESGIGNPKTTEFGSIGHGTVWEYEPAERGAGGDILEDYRLIQALLNGTDTDYDVYDGATWSAISPLSEWSVANRSRPIDFPDFTKGKWMTTKPTKIMGI